MKSKDSGRLPDDVTKIFGTRATEKNADRGHRDLLMSESQLVCQAEGIGGIIA